MNTNEIKAFLDTATEGMDEWPENPSPIIAKLSDVLFPKETFEFSLQGIANVGMLDAPCLLICTDRQVIAVRAGGLAGERVFVTNLVLHDVTKASTEKGGGIFGDRPFINIRIESSSSSDTIQAWTYHVKKGETFIAYVRKNADL